MGEWRSPDVTMPAVRASAGGGAGIRGAQQLPAVVEWRHLDTKRYYTWGLVTGLATRTLLYPSSVVKTRLQLQTRHAHYNGTVDAFRKIVHFEGPRALYRGFLPYTCGIVASQVHQLRIGGGGSALSHCFPLPILHPSPRPTPALPDLTTYPSCPNP